jgi:hypothetical protein
MIFNRLTRKHNWHGALDSFLLERRNTRFVYGSWDCCLFVCDAIQVMTGVDIAAPFRGAYSSHAEAVAAVRSYTGRPSIRAVAEAVSAEYGMRAIEALSVQRGDVVLIRRGKRDYSLGIIALNGLDVIVVGRRGLLNIPLDRAVKGWRV